ncbi:anhydro-N-acetylmuramic acid kinase [Flavobacterium chuncheonense]|uniref:Anhydro-N-acetylmuramic acid kinase n=1 Tax=Flavobacterium chuncheonense TaxID=2026653 RepID=A0ABW5YJA3_9FLAO
MFKDSYQVIGVMSGTSLDGVDLAHLSFFYTSDKWHFEILRATTVAYSDYWLHQLKNAVNFSTTELVQLNESYTKLLADIISQFVTDNKIQGLDAVCSHGHTILHQPSNGFTLQIGNLPILAQLINQNVVCDFRVQDVELGGQGAPLVPIGDRLLFSDYEYCLNLGGFSNISYEFDGNRIAYDISPVNTVLNFYANRLGFDYDDKGEMARSGQTNFELLEALNEINFYNQTFPKSLGIEFVQDTILPILESYSISDFDKMHTFVEHIAFQIKNVLPDVSSKMLVTGGGAYNAFLMEHIKKLLINTEVVVPNDTIIQYKEALIFGFLGVLKLRNEPNVLCSVTGAVKDHSSGFIYKN